MARPAVTPGDDIIETWEISFPGAVWVWVYDRREDQYKKQQVGQRSGSRMLHITRDDRKYNQELVPVENRHLDPFTNGSLRLLGSADRDETLDIRYHYSDEDLLEMFEIRDTELFREAMGAIESEVILRRLQNLTETQATSAQSEILREIIEKRYPVGGTQKTVREMIEAGDRIGAGRI